MSTPIKLIVGLGNPGSKHQGDRHNAGADYVQALADKFNGALQSEKKFHGLSCRINIDGKDVRLLIPTTYMNRSGLSVSALTNFHKIDIENILVAHDELDLDPGDTRLKQGGGHGGHNGLRDIISSLGNNKNFLRLRIGIGHPGNAKQVSNYVLKQAPVNEQISIDNSIDRALLLNNKIINGEVENAMKELHTKP